MTKRYRLLKDYPGAEAGDIYELDRLWLYNKSRIAITVELDWLKTHSDYFEEIKEQEWKIITCFNNKTEAWQEKDWHWYVSPGDTTTISCCIKDKCRIRSVIRLSDKQLFSIGDEVGYDNGNTRTKKDWAIDNFFIRESDGVLLARSKDNINVEIVDKWLYKNKPKEEQPFQFKDDMIYKIATIINAENALPENNIFDKSEKIYALFESQFKQQTNTIPSGEKYKQWDIPMNATIKEPKTERIQVKGIFPMWKDENAYSFHVFPAQSHELIREKIPLIKQAIEKTLNNE